MQPAREGTARREGLGERLTSSTAWRPIAALAFGIVCIGCSAIFVKNAAVPGPSSAFYRLIFALAGALPLLFVGSVRSIERAAIIPIVAGGSAFGLELVLWQMALLSTTAANATLLVNLAPIWVGIGARLFLHEHPSRRFWGGAALAFLGMALVAQRGQFGLQAIHRGDALAAIASFFYAAYLLVTREQRKTLPTIPFLVVSTTSAAVVALVACWVLGAPLTGFRADQWKNLLALGLLSHLGGHLAINFALGHLRVAKVSVALLAQPIVTAILAVALLDERLTLGLIAGGTVAIAGLVVALLPRGPGNETRS